MEKPWFPQKNLKDTVTALLKSFIFHLNVPISKFKIESDVTNHKEFPFFTYEGIREILSNWGIKSVVFSWEVEKLAELPQCSILFIHEKNGQYKDGLFIMFYGVNDNIVEYLHPRKGWVLENITSFSDKWAKIALAVTEVTTLNFESDFEEKEAEYDRLKFGNPDMKNVMIKDSFLTDFECDYIINLAEPVFKKSLLMEENNVEGYGRTSFSAEFHIFPNDKILENIRRRASELLEIPESHFEYFQCVSYTNGQEYQNHFDTFDENSPRGKKEIEESGQRKYTMLAYLNDNFDGGATFFPNMDLMIHPKKGRVLIFNNLDENSKVINSAYHAGLPVTVGRKYAVNIWVRNKPIKC